MRTDIQAAVTRTGGAVGSGVDVSGISAGWTLGVKIGPFSAGESASIQIEDSVDDFAADTRVVAVIPLTGGQVSGAERNVSIRPYELNSRIGVANATMRAVLKDLSGGSITYALWLEH